MRDEERTKEQLAVELAELRRRVAELEAMEVERKLTQDALDDREGFLSSVFQSIQDGISILDSDYTIIRVNPKMEQWYSFAMPLVGKKCYEAYHGRSQECEVCPTRQTLERGEAAYAEVPKRGPDGEVVGWLDLYSFPLVDSATGQMKGVIEYVRDITERKRAEEELRETRRYLASLIESSTDAIISTDGEGNVVLFNSGAEKLLGYLREEVLGRYVTMLYDSEERAREVMLRMREGNGSVAGFETNLRAKDGALIPVLISASLLFDAEGREAGSVGFSKDLRDRKQAERAVREAQAFYEQLVGDAGDAVVALDRDSTIITWNLGAEKLFGYEAREVVGRHGRFLVPEAEMERGRAIRRQVLAGGTVVDEVVRRIRKDGSYVDGLATYSPLKNPQGQVVGFCSIFKDITDRKRAEVTLSRFARQQTVVAQVGSLALGGGELKTIMGEAARLTADALDVDMCKILKLEEGVEELKLVAGVGWPDGLVGSARVEANHQSQAGYTLRLGQPVVVEDLRTERRFNGPPLLKDNGVVSGISVPMVAGNFVYGVMGAHSTNRRWFSEDDVHFLEAVANVLTTAVLRKQAEEDLHQVNEELRHYIDYIKKAQEQLVRSEKLAALGRLTAGVSHEILNPLNVITLRLHMILNDPSLSEDLVSKLYVLDEQAKRIAKITQDLLSFSRQRPPERKSLDFNETVRKTADLLEHDFKLQNISMDVDLADGLPELSADHDQLQQVVLNLVTNARDSMPEGGRISISTCSVMIEGESFLELRVEDTGRGISTEHMEKLFDPFFTTKAEGEGTGLGLAICQGIVEAHGGRITVRSSQGRGTAFVVQLPLEHPG